MKQTEFKFRLKPHLRYTIVYMQIFRSVVGVGGTLKPGTPKDFRDKVLNLQYYMDSCFPLSEIWETPSAPTWRVSFCRTLRSLSWWHRKRPVVLLKQTSPQCHFLKAFCGNRVLTCKRQQASINSERKIPVGLDLVAASQSPTGRHIDC